MRCKCLVMDHDDTTVNSTATIHFPSFCAYLQLVRPQAHYTLEEYFRKNFDPGILPLFTGELGFTDEELEDCRRGLLSGMNGVEDSLGGMETWYYIEVLRAGANSAAPIQTPAQARAALQAVTKEDVRSILRQLTLSVSYLLTKEEPTHA